MLAAGSSSRLGQPKQLLARKGESLLRRTARLAVEAGCSPVVVVLGFAAERLNQELSGLPVQPVFNGAWQEGMGSSLRCGVQRVAGEPAPAGVLVLVCDQPGLSAQYLSMLLERHRSGGNGITASRYAGRTGVPAVFSAALLPRLAQVEGDRGARDLIREVPDAQAIDWPEGALDVDWPEQLEGWSAC